VKKRDVGEPMFKFVGNMHGDETLGRQLILYMAEYLANNYATDRRVKSLLDRTEIYLLPTLNPDGFSISKEGVGIQCPKRSSGGGGGLFDGFFGSGGSASSSDPGRNNANGQDLNRDFPKQFDEPQKVTKSQLEKGRQPETV
jgi:carboxypeptidase D